MHLALFTQNLHVGGAERVMVNLATGLSELGVRVDLVLCEATGRFLAEVPPEVNVVNLETARPILCPEATG